MNKLHEIYIERLMEGEMLDPSYLKPFSRIRLKKSRNRKKFKKYFYRYITKEILETYCAAIMAFPLGMAFRKMGELDLDVVPMLEPNPQYQRELKLNRAMGIDAKPVSPEFLYSDLPKVELVYLDYQYSGMTL